MKSGYLARRRHWDHPFRLVRSLSTQMKLDGSMLLVLAQGPLALGEQVLR